jgi:hypothetical protein
MITPTPRPPGGLRDHTLPILGSTPDGPEPIGDCAIRLVLPLRNVDDPIPVDLNAWAITHPLGSVAGGTYTEVAFVDTSADQQPEHILDAIVRQLAGEVYGPGRWAFHYRPDQVPDAVLRHGLILRERVEVSAVEVWT